MTLGKSIPRAVTSEEKRIADSAFLKRVAAISRWPWVRRECISKILVGARGWLVSDGPRSWRKVSAAREAQRVAEKKTIALKGRASSSLVEVFNAASWAARSREMSS